MSATVREYLARPRQQPDPRVLALLEELGQVCAELEDADLAATYAPTPAAFRRIGKLYVRQLEITEELERLVTVEVPAEELH